MGVAVSLYCNGAFRKEAKRNWDKGWSKTKWKKLSENGKRGNTAGERLKKEFSKGVKS